MLGQRRRRWTNIEAALGERPVFAGLEFILGKEKDNVIIIFTTEYSISYIG